jgi:hypothetical protein
MNHETCAMNCRTVRVRRAILEIKVAIQDIYAKEPYHPSSVSYQWNGQNRARAIHRLPDALNNPLGDTESSLIVVLHIFTRVEAWKCS